MMMGHYVVLREHAILEVTKITGKLTQKQIQKLKFCIQLQAQILAKMSVKSRELTKKKTDAAAVLRGHFWSLLLENIVYQEYIDIFGDDLNNTDFYF